MNTAGVALITNGAATSPAVNWPGGRGMFAVAGTFGAATVSLQFRLPDGVTWVDVGASTSLTAAGGGLFELPPGEVRANVVGGAPAGLYVAASRIPV